MQKVKIIFNYFIGFIMTIILSSLVLLLILKFTVCNKDYLYQVIIDNDYYTKIDDEIKEEMELLLLSSGFNEKILDNIYTHDEVIADVNAYIDNVYVGKKIKLNKDNIRDKINDNIDSYIKETNLEYANKDDVKMFVDDLVNVYVNEICLYNFLDGVIAPFMKICKLINTVIMILSIMLVVLLIAFLIMKMHYINSIIMASGLIILFVRLFIFEKIDAENILIITEKFSDILHIVLLNLQENILKYSIILITLGLCLTFVKCCVKPRQKKMKILK